MLAPRRNHGVVDPYRLPVLETSLRGGVPWCRAMARPAGRHLMEVRFWAQTDVGRQREHNEDNFLVDKNLNLFIVADGMGGHAAGEVASATAVHEVRRYLAERQGQIRAYAADPKNESPLKINTMLEGAVRHACARIHQMAQENPARRGMGTTTEVLLVAGGRGFIAHVGDSRIYMLRQGTIHQMTV
ncbi:MAG: serine/threonine-protein phosphatase, partial [Deltaproteobacteria bacterium]|nr:serine/threonine-protein phosphatase [Deltaproteobacteria bacterium]